MISSGFFLKQEQLMQFKMFCLILKGLLSQDLYLCMQLIFRGADVVFDLSEPLVFKFLRRCNHQGGQGCRANTLHLGVNLVFYFFWDNIFSHNLQ